MNFKNIQGLKFPDDYFIKFFFKNELHLREDLTFLELGCSNGNNLMLGSSYNHSVIGVDLDEKLIEYAKSNFISSKFEKSFKFYNMDMREFCYNYKHINAEILILSNSSYYVPKVDFIRLLRNIKMNSIINSESLLFLRFRSLEDYRNGRGVQISENSYILDTQDENGVFCQFYDTKIMIKILIDELGLRDFHTLYVSYENIQNNIKVKNCDVIVWGIIN